MPDNLTVQFQKAGYYKIQKSKAKHYYLAVGTEEFVIFINTTKDFSDIVGGVFEGISELVGLIPGAEGFLGSLLTGAGSSKIVELFKNLSEKQNKSKAQKILENLDKYANQEKGLERVYLDEITELVYCKHNLFKSKSYIKIKAYSGVYKFKTQDHSSIDELIEFIEGRCRFVKIKSGLW